MALLRHGLLLMFALVLCNCNLTGGDFVKNVHIIFMNHLDVGYSFESETGFVSNVLNGYFHNYFPRAANISLKLREEQYEETFIYTTHPWLVSLYLNCSNFALEGVTIQCPNKTELGNFTAAVKRGDITWHAGPMNMQAENADETLFQFGLSLSDRLDKMFGISRQYKTLSQRDVPGMTQAVIPSLVKMNVSAISVGVNSGSLPPAVPKGAFIWKFNNDSVMATWHPGGYPGNAGPYPANPGGLSRGDCLVLDNFADALCFAFRTDNSGPPESVEEILGYYEILRKEFPDAKLQASTFENYFQALSSIRDKLPVFEQEVGDTWIQGISSDPRKMAQYRALYRVLSQCIESGQCSYDMPEVVAASTFLIKPGEHTWGLSAIGDNVNWTNRAFEKAKKGINYVNCTKSWDEQRQFIGLTMSSLAANPVAGQMKEELAKLNPLQDPTIPSDYVEVPDKRKTFSCLGAELGFGPQGAITTLTVAGIALASGNYPLSMFFYRTYNETDFDIFAKVYGSPGFDKPNVTLYARPSSKSWPTRLTHLYSNKSNPNCDIYTKVVMDDPIAVSYYGAPQLITVKYVIVQTPGEDYPELQIEYNIFNKTSTRLPESLSVVFTPSPHSDYSWMISKLGQQIDPKSVVLNSSQYQHAVDNNGVYYYDRARQEGIQILSLDVPLALTVTESRAPSPFAMPLKPIADQITGMAFNIYNNIWNTNYIYFYPFHDEDRHFKARFTLKHYSNSGK